MSTLHRLFTQMRRRIYRRHAATFCDNLLELSAEEFQLLDRQLSILGTTEGEDLS